MPVICLNNYTQRVRGSCIAGENCLFLHTINTSQLQNMLQNTNTAGSVPAIPDTSDDELFPSLDQFNATSTQKSSALLNTPISEVPNSKHPVLRDTSIRNPSSTIRKASLS